MRSLCYRPSLIPIRCTLAPDTFAGLDVATLTFPFDQAISAFLRVMASARGGKLEPKHYPPYRLLNEMLMLMAPSLAHGFEKYHELVDGQWVSGRRMLAIRGSDFEGTLECLPLSQVGLVIFHWLKLWGADGWIKDYITDSGSLYESAWDTLIQTVDGWIRQAEIAEAQGQTLPGGWRTGINPRDLLEAQGQAQGSLAFNAIPALLASLLHGRTAQAGGNTFRWRRLQESDGKTALVSEPIRSHFAKIKRNPETGETSAVASGGYFAYKLEPSVQTQAGRDEIVVHWFLRCQRYAEVPFFNKPGRQITVLVGANARRFQDWPEHTTLVRLTAGKASGRSAKKNTPPLCWPDRHLPRFLEALSARSLADLDQIFCNPRQFWKDQTEQGQPLDEYLIPHVEGFEYKRVGNRKHLVRSGFSLTERKQVLDTVSQAILGLRWDSTLPPDTLPADIRSCPVLRGFDNLYTDAERRRAAKGELSDKQRQAWTEKQKVVHEALQRALGGRTLVIGCFTYSSREPTPEAGQKRTEAVLYEALRQSLLLLPEEPLPSFVKWLPDQNQSLPMASPLDKGGLHIQTRHEKRLPEGFLDSWKTQMQDARRNLREAWRQRLRDVFKPYQVPKRYVLAALIELVPEPEKSDEFHPDQSIKGILREACEREGVASQMVRPLVWHKSRFANVTSLFGGESKGRALNAIREVLYRQTGVIFGRPDELYERTGLSNLAEDVTSRLDVIALCLYKTNADDGQDDAVRYCLAVRLRSNGVMDCLLPEETDWLPLPDAARRLGRRFADARQTRAEARSRQEKPATLSRQAMQEFVQRLLTEKLEQPAVIVVDAENWRSGSKNGGGWTQLTNGNVVRHPHEIVFNDVLLDPKAAGSTLPHLLGVVRLRAGDEAPHYLAPTDPTGFVADVPELSGFVDAGGAKPLHYLSVGRLPDAVGEQAEFKDIEQKGQSLYKSREGGAIAFKHPSLIEMLPFAVAPALDCDAGRIALCRIAHLLRFSPAWDGANTDSPLPMHLGDCLMKDVSCIL